MARVWLLIWTSATGTDRAGRVNPALEIPLWNKGLPGGNAGSVRDGSVARKRLNIRPEMGNGILGT